MNELEPLEIREGTIDEAVTLSRKIEAFIGPPDAAEYVRRFASTKHVVFIATKGKQPVGFKVGYDRYPGTVVFYSWLGGVLAPFRNQGIASALQRAMEHWCRGNGFLKLQFKTRNQHRAMIRFAMAHDFDLMDFKPRQQVQESRLIFEKFLGK